MAKTSKAVDLDAIDRLEEKIKKLVDVVGQLRAEADQMKAEAAQMKEDNQRLARELEAAQERLVEADATAADFTLLKEEREAIRTRVADMLEQLEGLTL